VVSGFVGLHTRKAWTRAVVTDSLSLRRCTPEAQRAAPLDNVAKTGFDAAGKARFGGNACRIRDQAP